MGPPGVKRGPGRNQGRINSILLKSDIPNANHVPVVIESIFKTTDILQVL
jgi:hypothetical protein